jgi:hypothetical protein
MSHLALDNLLRQVSYVSLREGESARDVWRPVPQRRG